MRLIKVLLGLLAAFSLFAVFPLFAQDESLPDTVTIEDPGRFPEGIEWDEQGGRFLLGSLRDGSVVAVADDGTITPFVDVPEEGLSSVGLHIDTNTNRLLVAYGNPAVFSDPEAAGRAALGIFDLETGEQLQFVDLGEIVDGRHFANDVTVDDLGNAYVTDTFSRVIYQVTPEGEATVFIQDDRLSFINGIDFAPDEYILVSSNDTATLWKILTEDPSIVRQVELSESFGADGMAFTPDGNLIAVATIPQDDGSTTTGIISFSSEDDWQSATVDQRFETSGVTTVAIREGEVYAIYAMLDQMSIATPPETFNIVRIDFPEE